MPSPQENFARVFAVLNGADFARLSALTVDDVAIIIRITALGVKPKEVPDLFRYAEGRPPSDAPPPTFSPAVLKIQAYSFVRDPGQYHATYGMASERAATLRDLLASDRQVAIDEIARVVNDALAKRGSTKHAVVEYGTPRGSPPANQGGVVGDDGLKALVARQTQVAGLAGTYKFEAEETDAPFAHRFRCLLGGGLATVAQSKRAATTAARLVRIFGREDDAVLRYVAEYRLGVAYFGDDIETDYDGKGRLVAGPDDADDMFVAANAPGEETEDA